MARTISNGLALQMDIFVDLRHRCWAHRRAMFTSDVTNRLQTVPSPLALRLSSPKIYHRWSVPCYTIIAVHSLDQMNRNFFMIFFLYSEVYFRSPFSHLPVRFPQTLIVSSLNFSANFGISRAPLLGLEAEKRTFYTPPVYPGKPWVRCGILWPTACQLKL